MNQLYLEDAYLKERKTSIAQQRIIKKKTAVILEDNIFYPGGGGQPHDTGCLIVNKQKIIITRIVKVDGNSWLCLDTQEIFSEETEVLACVDWERRYMFMCCHTTAHIVMGAIKRHVEGYSPDGIKINESGNIELCFSGKWEVSKQIMDEIIQMSNEIIKHVRQVYAEDFSEINDAVSKYKDIFRGSTNFKGDVRIVVIEGWDANPCGGLHVKNLNELNGVELVDFSDCSVTIRIIT